MFIPIVPMLVGTCSIPTKSWVIVVQIFLQWQSKAEL